MMRWFKPINIMIMPFTILAYGFASENGFTAEVIDGSDQSIGLTEVERTMVQQSVAEISALSDPSTAAVYGLSRAINADGVVCGFTDNVADGRHYLGIRAFFVYLSDGAIAFDGAPLPEHDAYGGAGAMLSFVGCPRWFLED